MAALQTLEVLVAMLEKWKKEDLYNWLKEYGLKLSGRKEDLVFRVANAMINGCETAMKRKLREKAEREQRAQEKLDTPTEKLPGPSSLKDWTNEYSNFPKLTFRDIKNYLVYGNCKFYKNEEIGGFKQLKAYNFFKDGHVQDIKISLINGKSNYCFIKAKVLPSMRTDTIYNVWVSILRDTAQVYSADCSCTAGLGEACNHIAALLFAIEDYTQNQSEPSNINDGNTSCTSQPCAWNKPRKRKLSPKKIDDVRPIKHQHGKKPRLSAVPNPKEYKACSAVNESYFDDVLSKLTAVNRSCVLHTLVEKEKTDENSDKMDVIIGAFEEVETTEFDSEEFAKAYHPTTLITKIQSNLEITHYFQQGGDQSIAKCISTMKITQHEADLIEQSTRGQNNNQKWKDARKGRVTASVFGQVCKKKPATSSDRLTSQVMGYSTIPGAVKSIQWGVQNEPVAKQKYIDVMKKKGHKRVSVMDRGLIVDPNTPYLGASPDGYVYCPDKKNYQRIIEIKCPYKWMELTPRQAAADKKFYCYIDNNGKIKLKTNSNYYYQIQGQLALTKRKWCDFVVWTPKGISVQPIKFKLRFWKTYMLPRLTAFFQDAVLPEILTGKMLNRAN